jgi:hypothetical protein
MTTLADQWQAHADTLPIDISQAAVLRERREWYLARLVALKAQPESARRDALIAEALGFARTIGSAVETA